MAHGISGNCGVAGAPVYWYDINTFAGGKVIADGSGNYNTGAVLADGTYIVNPSVPGKLFSPRTSTQVVAGADIAGVNFTSSILSASLSFTQLTFDTFHRANESPLNPAVWPQYFGSDIMQIVNNECVINLFPTNGSQDSDTANIAIDWIGTVPDQWIEFEISHSNKAIIPLYLRTGALANNKTVPCYRFNVTASTAYPLSTTMPGWSLDKIDVTGAVIDFVWIDYQAQEFQVGDVIRFAVLGGANGHLYGYLNGTLLFVANIADSVGHAPILTSGTPGFQLSSFAGFFDGDPQLLSDVGVINFKGGSVAQSSGANASLWFLDSSSFDIDVPKRHRI